VNATLSVKLTFSPQTAAGLRLNANAVVLVRDCPAGMVGYAELAVVTVTPGVLVLNVAETALAVAPPLSVS
jgi:hypothetical protein